MDHVTGDGEHAHARLVSKECRTQYDAAVRCIALGTPEGGAAPEAGVEEAMPQLLAKLRVLTSVTARGVFASTELLTRPCDRWANVRTLQLVRRRGGALAQADVPVALIGLRCPQLTQLHIGGALFRVSPGGMSQLLAAVPRLESLALLGVDMQQAAPAVFACTAAATRLTCLAFAPADMAPAMALAPALDMQLAPPSVVSLMLATASLVNFGALGTLAGLRDLRLTQVRNLTTADLDALPASARTLELWDCRLAGACAAGRPALMHLESVMFKEVDLDSGQPEQALPRLLQGSTALRELTMWAQYTPMEDLARGLATALGTARTQLQSLSLVFGMDKTRSLCEALAGMPQLKGLRVRCLPLREPDLQLVMPHLRSLTSLDIDVIPETATSLSCLRQLTGLRSLHLSDVRVWPTRFPACWLGALTRLTHLGLEGGCWRGPMRSPSVQSLTLLPDDGIAGPCGMLSSACLRHMPRLQRISSDDASRDWLGSVVGNRVRIDVHDQDKWVLPPTQMWHPDYM